jgi:hypothetical protein
LVIPRVSWVCLLSLSKAFCFGSWVNYAALVYNGINSTIDHMRGKHDTVNSMTAGALTGALFKSTGTSALPESYASARLMDTTFSWCKTCIGSGDVHVGFGWRMELHQARRIT